MTMRMFFFLLTHPELSEEACEYLLKVEDDCGEQLLRLVESAGKDDQNRSAS